MAPSGFSCGSWALHCVMEDFLCDAWILWLWLVDWVAPYHVGSSSPTRDQTRVPALQGVFLIIESSGKSLESISEWMNRKRKPAAWVTGQNACCRRNAAMPWWELKWLKKLPLFSSILNCCSFLQHYQRNVLILPLCHQNTFLNVCGA